MKNNAVSKVFLNLLFSVLISYSCIGQKHVKQNHFNGLSTVVFTTDKGEITVYIPDNNINEKISGRIHMVASGSSDKQRAKHKKTIENYQLVFDNITFPLNASSYSFKMERNKNTTIALQNEKGKTILIAQYSPTPKNNLALTSTYIPPYMVAGETGKLISNLDGIIINNQVHLNDIELEILAESENELFVSVPENISGVYDLQLSNNEEKVVASINILDIHVSAEKLSLLRTESTILSITISGLDGLETSVPITITNNSPTTIILENGNEQNFTINPENDAPTGQYYSTQTIEAIQNGSFSITATIVAPVETNLLAFTVLENDIKGAFEKAKRTGEAIDDIDEDISEKWEKHREAEDKRNAKTALANELITIDKVLDSVQNKYEDDFKDIIDAINNLKNQLPKNADSEDLTNALANAQSEADDCENHLENLRNQQKELEEQLEKEKKELDEHFITYKKIHEENGFDVSSSYDENGNFKFKTKFNKQNGIPQDKNDDDYRSELYFELLKLKKKYHKSLKAIDAIKSEIARAEDDCEKKNEALQNAKEAKINDDMKTAKEQEAEALCNQIKQLLKPLLRWCIAHPDLCDFKDKIEALLKGCPKNKDTLDDFWDDFNDLILRKKELEDSLIKAAEDNQNDMDDIENDISGLEDDKKALEDKRQSELDAADQLKKQRAKEIAESAAKEKARSDANKKKRDQQKKNDDKVKDLIKKAKSEDAGEDALKNLLKGMGLDLLDEATGNMKLGKILGGILTLKDIPDCACPMFKALKEAISAKHRNKGESITPYVEAYLLEWQKCANLPSLASINVLIDSTELIKAINGMSTKQSSNAIKSLEQAIRIQCKK